MKFLELFTQEHIRDVLKRTFSYSDKSEILFSVDKCKVNEKFKVLKVNGDGVKQQYLLVKIPTNVKAAEHPQVNYSNVLYPVFVIESINKECYGAFKYHPGMEHFVSPAQNNIECLKVILLTLAEYQALELADSKDIQNTSEYNLKDASTMVTSLDFFKDIDETVIKHSMESLQRAVNKLFKSSNLLVRSIGCPLAYNVYINQNTNESILLNVSSTKRVPAVYDALLYIFALSNEKFRQEYFEALILFYFDALTDLLQKLRCNVADKITRTSSEHEVKVLLPVVKFNIVSSRLKMKNSPDVRDILTNILNFLKHPLINQEDIYEATKNKIGSCHYDLLDYNLVSLSENNGHLGEYYHLRIKIKAEGKERELQLFAKFLITSTEIMEKILKSGPSKKEEFFYKTLLPLFSNYGLGSLLDFAPRCYLSRSDWLLILDDLSLQGYVGFKPNTVLNYDGLRAIIEIFAKFHACTIILEEILSAKSGKIVRLDESYGEFLKESILIYGDDNNPLQQGHDATLEVLYYIVEKFPEVTKKLNVSPDEIRTRLKKFFLSIFSKVTKSDTIRNVINHGDVFVANMLFKFGEGDLITSGILIDFQMLKYITPTYDLLVFLFCNSTKETRDMYLKVLIEEYYQCISENIRKFNYDPELVFPKKSFNENINFMMSAGIMGAFMYAHVLHIDPDFREEIAHDEEKFDYYLNNHKDELVDLSWNIKHYRIVMTGLVEDIVDVIKNDF